MKRQQRKTPKELSATAKPVLVKRGSITGPEIGAPGLKQAGGYLYEEFVRSLQNPQRAAAAFTEMRQNSALVGGMLLVMKNVLRQAARRVEPFSDKAEDRKLAEYVEQCFDDLDRSRTDLLAEVYTFVEQGYSPMEVTYKKRQGWRAPKNGLAQNVHSSRFNDGGIGWARIALRSQESVTHWGFDDGPDGTGDLVSLFQMPAPMYIQREIPIDRLLLFRTTAEKGNPQGYSMLRNAYFDWLFVKKLTEIAAIGAERDISGIPVLSAPAENFNANATSDQAAMLTRLKQIGENIRVDDQACILMPQAIDPESKTPLFDFKLLGSPGAKQFDISALIARHERLMAMSLASDFMLLGHEKVGSYALSSSKTDVYALVMDALLDIEDDVWNRQAIPRLASLNGWPMDRLPKCAHGTVAATDVEQLAKLLTAYTGAGGVLDRSLDEYVREQAGWPAADVDTGVDPGRREEDGEPEADDPASEGADPQSAEQAAEERDADRELAE